MSYILVIHGNAKLRLALVSPRKVSKEGRTE